MAGYLNRIATRMWLLAGLMTTITLTVGLGSYYTVAYFDLLEASGRMPPKARAELDRLIANRQQSSDRYFELYDRFAGTSLFQSEGLFLFLIAAMSTGIGGSIAYVLARRISRPITAVAQAAAKVSAGDRSVRVAPDGTSGETGELVQSFNRMAADIETYERERTVLTAGIAHELRTPLTILKGRLHGLLDGVIEPSTGEADRLLRQVEHLLRLVDDLRTLAHADAGELELDLKVVDLAQIMRVVVADLRSAGESIAFELSCESVRVRVDPLRVTQIFNNLLTNAVKHTPAGGVIAVSTRNDGSWATARVIDEGTGFRAEDSQRLFMPFWRAGQSKVAGKPSSGMGLALAAKLAEAQGGRIEAANRLDRSGATFSVIFPACRLPTQVKEKSRDT